MHSSGYKYLVEHGRYRERVQLTYEARVRINSELVGTVVRHVIYGVRDACVLTLVYVDSLHLKTNRSVCFYCNVAVLITVNNDCRHLLISSDTNSSEDDVIQRRIELCSLSI